MNFKSQNAITMLSLIIYIGCFVLIAGIVGSITYYFYNNTELLNEQVYSAAEYNKLNAYLVDESKINGNEFVSFTPNDTLNISTLTFKNGDKYTLDKTNHLLYYNSICLCEDVQDFEVASPTYDTGKEVLNIKVSFTNKTYSTSYTME